MKIYFVRHGETSWNKEKKLQGRTDIPLNDAGIRLAYTTSEAMKDIPFDIVYSSPLKRALKTARILSENRGLEVLTDQRLIEMAFGDGEGQVLAGLRAHPELKIHNFIHNPAAYIPSESGETFEQLYERCQSFIDEVIIPAEKKYNCMLLVGHGAMIRGMIHCINNRPTKDFWIVTHKNCSVTIADCTNGKLTLEEEAKIYYKEEIKAVW